MGKSAVLRRLSSSVIFSVLMMGIFFLIRLDLHAEQILVHEKLGALHGLLLLRDESGKEIAAGDQTQVVRGTEVHSRLTFRFRDGSLDDEETVFRQGRTFQLVRDHHVQKGPSFPRPLDMTIDIPGQKISWVEASDKGSESKSQHMALPSDVANGMVSLAAENFPGKAGEITVSYVVVDSKPRVVKFVIRPDGTDKAFVGSESREVKRYNIHIEIGGIAGALAPLVGKQPPDFKLWIIDGAAPVFAKMVGSLYEKGPVWTMLLSAPRWTEEKR